jgi:hypothetical protein
MSTSSSACSGFAASGPRRSSRKAIPQNFFGGAAIACLVLGCGWIVYTNIIAADVYPTLGSANYDSPVISRPPTVAARSAPVVRNAVAALSEPATVISAQPGIAPGPSLSFEDRFAAAAPQGVEPRVQAEAPRLAEARRPQAETPGLAEAPKPRAETPKLAEASKPKESSPPVRVAAIAPAPRPVEPEPAKGPGAAVRDMAQRAKAAVLSIASADKPSIVEKLWGKPQAKASLLAYASADASFTGSLGPSQNSATLGAMPRYERDTAVYDISAHMVYLPDGTRLEAHSGLGGELDDPRSAHIRMRGVTPPHLYELTPREALFHGVPALRLNPVGGEDAIYGRTGLLAHTFMLGPNGDSNGCVSFRDYNAFLNAYRNQGIKRLAVVARVE